MVIPTAASCISECSDQQTLGRGYACCSIILLLRSIALGRLKPLSTSIPLVIDVFPESTASIKLSRNLTELWNIAPWETMLAFFRTNRCIFDHPHRLRIWTSVRHSNSFLLAPEAVWVEMSIIMGSIWQVDDSQHQHQAEDICFSASSHIFLTIRRRDGVLKPQQCGELETSGSRNGLKTGRYGAPEGIRTPDLCLRRADAPITNSLIVCLFHSVESMWPQIGHKLGEMEWQILSCVEVNIRYR